MGKITRDIESRFFTRLAEVGADKAAVSLSRLLGASVEIRLSGAKILSIDDACLQLNTSGAEGLGIGLQIFGDLAGTVLLAFYNKDLPGVCGRIKGIPQDAGLDNPLVQSALMEMGNILTGSFLSAVAEHTGLDYLSSPPAMARDMLDAITVSIIASSTDKYNQVVYMENQLVIDDKQVQGGLIYFPVDEAISLLNKAAKGSVENE